MILQLELSNFNGPMELLLEMVREHKLDLFALDIRSLSDQYGRYVSEQLTHLGLDDLAEYLVMAAYLYDLKAKTLLPVDEDNYESMEADFERDQLVTRLIEYQRYKNR